MLKKPGISTSIRTVTFRIPAIEESVLVLDTAAYFCSNFDPNHLSSQQYNKIQQWDSFLARQIHTATGCGVIFRELLRVSVNQPTSQSRIPRNRDGINTPTNFCFTDNPFKNITDNGIVDCVNIHGIRCLLFRKLPLNKYTSYSKGDVKDQKLEYLAVHNQNYKENYSQEKWYWHKRSVKQCLAAPVRSQ